MFLIVAIVVAVAALGYVMLNKKLIPHRFARIASRVYFVPCLPCTVLGQWFRYGSWWTESLEDHGPPVFLGGAPFEFLGKPDQ